ncbi:MAG: alpha/beta hydrolase, partial [Thermoleophilaceae bacterium]|nr:alpha/beta hydrolase [Thermoleophilaceae bacterium]
EEVPERYAVASPGELLPLGVPTLLVHGDRDTTVPPFISEDYARAAGDECELVLVPGDAHRAPVWPRSGCWKAVLDWL